MAAVVVVHGIGQQYGGPETLHLPLARSLRDGVGFAGLVPPAVEDIRTAFYQFHRQCSAVHGGGEADLVVAARSAALPGQL